MLDLKEQSDVEQMLKLLGMAAVAAFLSLSAAAFGQTSSQDAHPDLRDSNGGAETGTAYSPEKQHQQHGEHAGATRLVD
jgi:hypothetical protein